MGKLHNAYIWTVQIGTSLLCTFRFFVPICINCVYCVNCTMFGQLILRIIIKIDATRCQILRLKCTKIVFGWGCAPDPAVGAYDAPQTP